jgi:hypothetical protein
VLTFLEIPVKVHVLFVEHHAALRHNNHSMLRSSSLSETGTFSLVDVDLLRLVERTTETSELGAALEGQVLTIETYLMSTYSDHVRD